MNRIDIAFLCVLCVSVVNPAPLLAQDAPGYSGAIIREIKFEIKPDPSSLAGTIISKEEQDDIRQTLRACMMSRVCKPY